MPSQIFFFGCFQGTSTSEWARIKVIMKNVISFRNTKRHLSSGFKNPSPQIYRQEITNHLSCCQHSSHTPTHMMFIWIAVFVFYTSVIRQYSFFFIYLGPFVSGISWGKKDGHFNGCKDRVHPSPAHRKAICDHLGVGCLAQWYLTRCPGTSLLPPEHFACFVLIGIWTKNPPKLMCFWILKCQVIIFILHLLHKLTPLVEIQCYRFCICSARYCLNVYFPLILCLPSLH